MLQTQGFDPFTQSAAYYRLTGDAPETNTVEVSVQNASRDAVYAPASMEKVTDGDVHERRDALLKGRGLFGARNYTVTEVSGTRPSELMVAESWVSSPQTEEQTAYAEAESIYRSFVYDAYTAADEDLLPVLNRLFWQDYDDENDGVYSALSRIREVLKAQVRYSETAEATPDNADPIAYFLTDSRKGNAVLDASATVQALRAHGIPAHYAERRRHRMSIEERVRQSQKLMFKLISLWGIDAALGWETSAINKALADTLPSVKPGEYERVNGLLEKTIYGGIVLEPFEERALDLFVQRLWERM
ncbi:transglutaminase domain-containing protein [Agathobaculum butyriciproducens]